MAQSTPVVRADDLRRGWSRQFAGFERAVVARSLDEVVGVVRAAEEAATAGRWVVGYIAYEAAPAFDAAMVVRPPVGDLPLAWFGIFAEAVEMPSPDLGSPGSAPVGTITRAGGSEWYRQSVETIRRGIERGDVYQVNLTDRFRSPAPHRPSDLYAAMARAQRGSYNAFVHHDDTVVMSASPELFIHWDGDVLSSSPMKGTRPRGLDAAADALAVDDLVQSEKDRAENVMIVDLIRNDMSRVAVTGSVRVPELFAVERYETVWQMTSTVQCRTAPATTLVDVLTAMFPCGSVTGAPKVAAMQMIASLEPGPRGVYCGAVGVLAPPGEGPRAVFSVAIRTAVADLGAGVMTYGAGGGITYDSDPAAEDAEAEAKTAVLRRPRPTFAVFETMRAVDGRVLRRAHHLRRLAATAAYFGFAGELSAVEDALDAALAAAVTDVGPEALRVRLEWRRDGSTDVAVAAVGATPAVVRLGVSERGALSSGDPFGRHKTTWREAYDRARRSFGDEVDDVVMVNERGEAAETTVASLLFRRPDSTRWCTPPLAAGGLDGVGRRVLLESGQVDEASLFADELARCELAVVSSLRGVRRAFVVGASAGVRDGVDEGECQPVRPDVVDAQDRRTGASGSASRTDRGDVPFLDIGGSAHGGDEPLA